MRSSTLSLKSGMARSRSIINRDGPNWTLSVSDDGIGMPPDAANVKAGLGTSIIQALSAQLNAVIGVTDANPGTTVSITHTQIAAVRSIDAALDIRAI